jgi:hypothetical protein
MSQRESGYERKALDQYKTPSWVALALVHHLPEINGVIWEPACGGGKMVVAGRADHRHRHRRRPCAPARRRGNEESHMTEDQACILIEQ